MGFCMKAIIDGLQTKGVVSAIYVNLFIITYYWLTHIPSTN